MDPEIHGLAMPIIAAKYAFEKIFTRFECREYIDNTVLPKLNDYIAEESCKYAPILMDGFSFPHDTGELNIEEDDEFHDWKTSEDELIPPKIDCHASDSASLSKVQIFNNFKMPDLSDIQEGESHEKSLDKSRKLASLNVNNIDQLNKSNGSGLLPGKSPRPFDARSSTSKKTSVIGNKLRMKAKNHLFASKDAIKEIVQLPIPDEKVENSLKEVVYKDKLGKETIRKWDSKQLEKEEDDDKVLHLREMLNKKVFFIKYNFRNLQERKQKFN